MDEAVTAGDILAVNRAEKDPICTRITLGELIEEKATDELFTCIQTGLDREEILKFKDNSETGILERFKPRTTPLWFSSPCKNA